MDYTEEEKENLLNDAEWVALEQDLFPHQWSYYLKMKFTLRWDSDYNEWQVLENVEDDFYNFLDSLKETCSLGRKRGRAITSGQFKVYCLASYDSEKKEWSVPAPLKEEALDVWESGLEASSIYPAIVAQRTSGIPDTDMQQAILYERSLRQHVEGAEKPKKKWMRMVEFANAQKAGSVLYAYLDTDEKTVVSNATAEEVDHEIEGHQVSFTIICPKKGKRFRYVWDRDTMENWGKVTWRIRELFGMDPRGRHFGSAGSYRWW